MIGEDERGKPARETHKETIVKTVMVRYKVKEGRAEENMELIRQVFKELEESRPSGLRYASFRMPGGVTLRVV